MTDKIRKEWRETDTPWLAYFDFIGLRHFIYGGDPDWQRRRWLLVMSLSIGFFSSVAACISTSLGRLPIELTKAVIDGYFSVIMIVVPGFILGAAWDAKNKMTSGATISESSETITESDPSKVTEKSTKETKPAGAGDDELPPLPKEKELP